MLDILSPEKLAGGIVANGKKVILELKIRIDLLSFFPTRNKDMLYQIFLLAVIFQQAEGKGISLSAVSMINSIHVRHITSL